MKTDVDTCLRELADWYIQHRRNITLAEMTPILQKHCGSEAEVQKFIGFMETGPGQARFRTLLRERRQPSYLKEPPKTKAGVAKEPWQMTRNDFADSVAPTRRTTGMTRDSAGVLHKESVRLALSEGKPVPSSVLADYPDLIIAKRDKFLQEQALIGRDRQGDGTGGKDASG